MSKFNITITCNYPDDKEIDAAVTESPVTLQQIFNTIRYMLEHEPDITSFVLTVAKVRP